MKKLAAVFLATWLGFFAAVSSAAIVNTLPFNLQNGTTADATQVMSNFNQILANVNANAAKNGVNGDITALTALTAPPGGYGSIIFQGGTATGTADAIVVTTQAPTQYFLTYGNLVSFLGGTSPTDGNPVTLTVNGTSTAPLRKRCVTSLCELSVNDVAPNLPTLAYFDGTQYVLVNAGFLPANVSLRVLLATYVASNSSNLTDTTNLTSTYSEYELACDNIIPVVSGADFILRPQVGGTFPTSNYKSYSLLSNTNGTQGNASTTAVDLSDSLATSQGTTLQIKFNNPAASTVTPFNWQGVQYRSTGIITTFNGGGSYQLAGGTTGFRLSMTSGNIASGYCKLYGWN